MIEEDNRRWQDIYQDIRMDDIDDELIPLAMGIQTIDKRDCRCECCLNSYKFFDINLFNNGNYNIIDNDFNVIDKL